MKDMKFLTIKLVDKGGGGVNIKFKRSGIHQSEGAELFHTPIHPKFKKAMDGLKIHLAVLSGALTPELAKEAEELESFRVNGYHVSGKDGQEGIIIVGGRDTEYGYVGINTPLTALAIPEPATGNEYILVGDLNKTLRLIEKRTDAYLDGSEIGQPSMYPEEETVTNIQVVPPLSNGMTYAAADAMARIAEDDDGEELTGKRKKRVPQSAKNKSGIAKE